MSDSGSSLSGSISLELLKHMYEQVYMIRQFELAGIQQYRQGNIRGYFHPYLGEEAVAVGVSAALEPDDYIVSTHRGHGHAIAKGHEVKYMMAELLGKATGYCGGLGGSMHISSRQLNNLGANGIVAAGLPIAAGAAMSIKQRKTRQVVVAYATDGGSNNGTFHEALNLAAIYDLPVIFVIENNQYAVSTRIQDSTRIEHLSIRATGYGIPGATIDGNDATAVYEAMIEPISRARAGEGPTLIEAVTYRHGGHHVNDPGAYMPKELLEFYKGEHDPLTILARYLLEAGVSEAELGAIRQRVENVIAEGVAFALESPEPTRESFLAAFVEA